MFTYILGHKLLGQPSYLVTAGTEGAGRYDENVK